MQTTLVNTWMKPVRFFATGTCAVLFAAFTLCLSPAPAHAVAPPSPIVVAGPLTQLGTLGGTYGGGWDNGADPIGGSFAVGPNGDVIVGDGYGLGWLQITPSGTESVLATFASGNEQPGAASTTDIYGNVYVASAAVWSSAAYVFKLPYNASTGTYTGFTSSTIPTTNCAGGTQDTAACIFASAVPGALTKGYSAGFADIAFDAQGNFYFSTDTQSENNSPNTIYECLASDLPACSSPILVYADSNPMGAMAIDPWGNLFFIDGAGASTGASYLKEIPVGGWSSSTPATTPTTLETVTTTAGYNGLAGLTIAGNGTIYFSDSDGILAIPNTSTGPVTSAVYVVSTPGGKGLALDAKGNLYLLDSNNNVDFIPLNHFSLGSVATGTAATAVNATIFDSSASCSPTETVAVTQSGVTSTEFTATAGSTCSTGFTPSNGTFSSGPLSAAAFSSYSLTLNFTPSAVGTRTATLTITDSANHGLGTVALNGVGQGAEGNVDPGVFTSYTTGLSGPESVAADAAGDVFVADPSAGKVLEFPSGSTSSTTPTQIGSGFTHPVALAFDANGDLFVADNAGPQVVEISNTGTTGAFVAGGQQTIISSSFKFAGVGLSLPTAIAVGPNGTLYISDSGNSRVVAYNLATGQGGVTLAQSTIEQLSSPTGLQDPQGLAVDSSGNLYIADSAQNLVFIVWSSGVVTTVAPPSVTSVTGVAVDAAGDLIVADSASDGANGSNIVFIPNVSGTLTTSQATVIEAVSPTASSLSMDWAGDLYVASSSGASANIILRSQVSGAAINLGSVADGANNSGNITLESTGNVAAVLPVTDVTEPSNYNWITLEPAATNGCNGGGAGAPGAWCQFTATFAPPAGLTAGPYSDTAGIVVTTPAITIPVVISGTATASAALPNSITWVAPTTGYVGQVINLSATSTSTEPVSFASTTSATCSVAGNTTSGFTATFTGAGTCSIQATVPACSPSGCSVSGNLYAAALPVSKSITLTTLTPAVEPTLLMLQNNATFPAILGGGVLAGPIGAGSSIGVGNNGYVAVSETYGGNVDIYNLAAGTVARLGAFSSPGGVAADSQGNLYIANQYSNKIAKLPYVSGAYAALSATSGTTPNCTGTSTTECIVGPIAGVSAIGGVGAITFDSTGDLFLTTDNNGTAQFSIWECTAACLSTGTPAPVEIFQEPAGSNPVTTGQLYIGGLGVDPWGNVFFTDSNMVNQAISSPNNEATYSDVYELPTSTGAGFGGATTGYAAAPTLLQTFCDGNFVAGVCDGSSAGGYDNNLDALAVAPDGTVYYATLYNGVVAIPNTRTGGPVIANQYPVFGTGAKVLGMDANGNLYEVTGALSVLTINDLTVPTAQYLGTPTTASASVVVNGIGYCPSTGPNLSFAFSGADAADFSATAGSTCSGLSVGGGFLNTNAYASSYPATITFTPNNPGSQTVTVTASDTNYGGVGTSTVSGLAQTTPQTISFTAPTTTTYTYAAAPNQVTVAMTVANGGSNFPVTFTIDASSTGAGTLSSTTVSGTNSLATLTVTQAGPIVIDAVEPAGLASNNTYYSQSNQAQLTLTINQASQTITFTPIAQSTYTYAAAPNQITIPLSATGGASGNAVEFSVDASSTGTATITPSTMVGSASLATLTVTGAGTIVIDASQAASTDYAAGSLQNAQTLTVNQATQTITFVSPTQAIHFIAGGITVPVTAMGGGSDNPITFTVDPSSTMTATIGASTVSGANSTATLTIPAQGSVVSGTIVLDATQPQSANYAAASATPLIALVIMAPLPTQTITFNNPGTQVVGTSATLSATASSTLPVSFTSSTTSVCTLVGAVVSFNANVTTASTCTIVATQPGDNVNWAAAAPVTLSFTVNPTGQTPSINLNLSLSALTIQPGTSGLTQLTITSMNNFTGSLALTCSGLPSGYTCSANPNPVTIAEGGTATTTITVTPPATSAMVHHDSPLAPLAAVAFALGFLGFRKRTRLQLLIVLALGLTALGALSACGGSAATSSTKATLSTATIKVAASGLGGASSSVQQSTTFTVTAE